MRTTLVLAIGALLTSGTLSADDWPGFRGPTGNGISAEKSAPTTWGPGKNIKWKAPLPQKCNGSPIVSNGRVFVSCPEDDQGKERSLFCFDRKDGKKLWVRTVSYKYGIQGEHADTVHDTNTQCSGTPAADGKIVVVWHNSAGLHAYDFEGKELWKRDLGEFRHIWGHATSPIIRDGKVFLNSGPGKKVFFTALELSTGKTLWETDEPSQGEDPSHNELKQPKGSWSSPVFAKVDGKEQLLCTMPTRVVAYDPANGKVLWFCEGIRPSKGDLSYSSPVVAGDVLVAIGGYGGASFGVRLGGSGNVTDSRQLWRNPTNPQSIGSGVVVDGKAYIPFETEIQCLDPQTGKDLWRDRGGKGEYWGSIVLAGGRLYVTNQSGGTVVFKPNPDKFERIALNELGERTNSTPAVSDGEIFIRTHKSLVCIAE